MDLAISNRVVARNGIGRFLSQCEEAATATVNDAIDRGAKLSKGFAPVGVKADPRTIRLRDSIESEMTGATSGHWYASARHAIPQEKGGSPHFQTGDVSFYWEKKGRSWAPGSNLINHPGNPATHYLKRAYDIVMKQVMDIAREKYPG